MQYPFDNEWDDDEWDDEDPEFQEILDEEYNAGLVDGFEDGFDLGYEKARRDLLMIYLN